MVTDLNDAVKALYDKQVVCPACNTEFIVKMVRMSARKVVNRDTDFMVNYAGINPLFYEVWVCNHCGYAALEKYFTTLKGPQRSKIQQQISQFWQPRPFEAPYNLDTAIIRYKLALLNAEVKEAAASETANLCLKLGWLYRQAADEANEQRYLAEAYHHYNEAYEKESFPITNLDECTLMYLLGELARRTGNTNEALKWFSKIIVNPNAKPTIKEMARDQKDLIKQFAEK